MFQRFAVFCALILLSLSAVSCGCSCTLMHCYEGISIEVFPTDFDRESPETYLLSWSLNGSTAIEVDSLGFVTNAEGEDGLNFWIMSETLPLDLPESIDLHLVHDDFPDEADDSYELEWEQELCNTCTGGPQCSDDMVSVARLVLDF